MHIKGLQGFQRKLVVYSGVLTHNLWLLPRLTMAGKRAGEESAWKRADSQARWQDSPRDSPKNSASSQGLVVALWLKKEFGGEKLRKKEKKVGGANIDTDFNLKPRRKIAREF